MILEKEKISRKMSDEIKKIVGDDDVKVSVFINSKPKIEDFIFLFQKVLELSINELSPSTCKVLFLLLSMTQYQNTVRIHIETIQEKLSISKPTVVKAIQQLIATNVVLKLKDTDDKRHNVYYLNPYIAWKGKITKRIKKLREHENQLKLNFENISGALPPAPPEF